MGISSGLVYPWARSARRLRAARRRSCRCSPGALALSVLCQPHPSTWYPNTHLLIFRWGRSPFPSPKPARPRSHHRAFISQLMASESALIPLEPPASAGLALQPRSCPFNIIFWVYNSIQRLVRVLQQSGAGRGGNHELRGVCSN